jgi:hypothetical protein
MKMASSVQQLGNICCVLTFYCVVFPPVAFHLVFLSMQFFNALRDM